MKNTSDLPSPLEEVTRPPILTSFRAIKTRQTVVKVLSADIGMRVLTVESRGQRCTVIVSMPLRKSLLNYMKNKEPDLTEESMVGLLLEAVSARNETFFRWEVKGRDNG